MQTFVTAAAVFAACLPGAALADLCTSGSVDDGGNYYCQAVDAITYTGLTGSGSYNKVTDMDSTTGTCSSTPYGYSGSMAPLDEEVSLHFRGPLQLKQFAVYSPSSSSSSSSKAKRSAMNRHGHEHLAKHKRHAHEHAQAQEAEKRALGDVVVATIDGQVVSWLNNWSGESTTAAAATSTAAAVTSAAVEATSSATTFSAVNRVVASSSASSASSSSVAAASSAAASSSSAATSSSSSAATETASSGSWTRKAYYNAESGSADGVVFLNHNGGSGSGVFDYEFGNSLSYASTDGTTAASSPQILSNTQLASDIEVVIMSDTECDGDCGYVRDGTVAYHGWSGAQKAFLFEFQMPLDGNADASTNGDMPAIWMLNAQIPRTLQYGNADCSCWTTGCGEFDIFEVLAPGDLRCKSTLHGNINGGDSDYFKRPTDATIKAALILNGDDIHIKQLSDDYEFGSALDESSISDICSTTLIQSLLVSIFNLAS